MNLAETRLLAALIKGVRATMLVSEHESKVQRQITNKAMAVRLFAEAGFRHEATVVLDELVEAFSDDKHEAMVKTLAEKVRKHWEFHKLVSA